MDRRTAQHLDRERAVNRLAELAGDYDKARSLYLAVVRYALADAREWERDNDETTFDGSWREMGHLRRQKALDERRKRLDARLKPMGLKLENYGLYPSIVDGDGYEQVALVLYG